MKKIILIIFLLLPINSFGVSPYPIPVTDEDKYVQTLINNARHWMEALLIKSPKYVWGGSGLDGGDCSGQVYWIFHKAGIPFQRTTALKIWSGAWPGINYSTWDSTTFPDGIFFSWKKTADHIGLIDFKLDYPEQLSYVESSSGANKFKRTEMKKNSAYDKSFLGIRVFDISVGYKKEGKVDYLKNDIKSVK